MGPTPNFQSTTELLLWEILGSLQSRQVQKNTNNLATVVSIKNSTKVRSGILTLTQTQPVQQLPNLTIPDGRVLLILSDPGNPLISIIYVDGVQPSLASVATAWPLVPGQSVGYQVTNANCIWAASPANYPLVLHYTVEVD